MDNNPTDEDMNSKALSIALALASPVCFVFGKDLEVSPLSPERRSLAAAGIGDFPLEGRVEALLSSTAPEGWTPTGKGRSFYLDLMEPIVSNAAKWVDAEGSLIDPVIAKEWNQATPRFVSSAAILLKAGRLPEIKEPAFRAMSKCCARLKLPETRNSSPDFWMRELVTAYLCFDGIAPKELMEQWKRDLSEVEPEAVYKEVDPTHRKLSSFHNWCVYGGSGESMRQSAGIGASRDFLWGDKFLELYIGAQMGHFTSCGMYRDPNDPITYDVTTRLQFASAIAYGYKGPLRQTLEEILRRADLTMLLFMSPEGFIPFGGRSSQFNFQEAMVAALCELEAVRYKSANPALASAFKRQAHLGAVSIKPWVMDAKPPRHIKNLFSVESLHGCDPYGQYSVYSLLCSSFLGLAALYADDSIAEAPAPSEIGGYAFFTGQEAFHKVFASCQGTYVEIDTAANGDYDATGIGRVLFPGMPGVLPLGMPFSPKPHYKFDKSAKPARSPLALGPEWDSNGKSLRLAQLSEGLKCEFSAPVQTRDLVQLSTVYSNGALKVSESCALSKGRLEIACSVSEGDAQAKPLRYLVPIPKTDGANSFKGELSGSSLLVSLNGKVLYEVAWPEGAKAVLREGSQANRNGVFDALSIEFPDGMAVISINSKAK